MHMHMHMHMRQQQPTAAAEQQRASSSPPRDLLDALLQPPRSLGAEEARDVLLDVLTAGGDTTSSTLSTAALLLAKHSAAANRVASEAAAVFLGTRDGGEEDLAAAMAAAVAQPAALAYTRAVLMEATRLYPAAPLLLRVALSDTTLGGVAVPRGSGVVASTAQLCRHPAAWEEPDAFVPERFLTGDARHRSADAAKAYVAFGAGPRSCIGQQLALTIASLALAWMVNAADEEGLLDPTE